MSQDDDQGPVPDSAGPAGPAGTTAAAAAGAKAGISASHPPRQAQPFLVAPTTEDDFNTLSLDLVAVACVQLPDVLFEFDSSFPNPSVAAMLEEVQARRQQHKSASGLFPPLSVFGHTDPVGNDDYNKQLSGRRAMAIYAVLTRDLALWDFLLDHPHGGDDWKAKKVLATMRLVLGQPASASRAVLVPLYMELLSPVPLAKGDFIGQGGDAKGKADFQGCSEFNPLLLLSTKETQTLPKAKRDEENGSNRRVIIFLFRPGMKVNPARWPCPTALAGTGDCFKRFFGPPRTGNERRQPGPERREFAETLDTFACRFYDRIARLSPCELPVPPPQVVNPLIILPQAAQQVVRGITATTTAIAGSSFAVVKKTYTNPARMPVILKTDKPFDGTGEFSFSDRGNVQFFLANSGGTAIRLNRIDNVFTGAQLTPGITIFAEGIKASATVDDIALTLTLSARFATIASVARAQMTAVDVILDICEPRTDPAKDPTPLPQPPATAPPASAKPKDKLFGGRFVRMQDAANTQERAMLIVRLRPADFSTTLELVAKPGSLALFDVEDPTAAGAALTLPLSFASSTVPAAGRRFFIQGTGSTLSNALRDVQMLVGIKGVEADCDHVATTVVASLVLRTFAPVACPGLDFRIEAVTSATGTFSWSAGAGASARFVDGSGALVAVPTTALVRLRGFQPDNVKGELPERKVQVTLTFTSGGIAAPYSLVVTVHRIQFVVNNATIAAGVTRANEVPGGLVLRNAPGGVATMATTPSVMISLATTCPQPAACAANHRVGWLQTMLTNNRERRFTSSLTTVNPTMPIRDARTTLATPPPPPFYGQVATFTANFDSQNAPHDDTPNFPAPFVDPPSGQQLRIVNFSDSFTAWLTIQNLNWRNLDPNTSLLFLRNFDWSMQLNVIVNPSAPAGSRTVPIQSTPTIPAAMGNGRGVNTPKLDAPIFNTQAAGALVTVAAPTIP